MGVFQASMLEVMQSLRDEFKSLIKASEVGVDQTLTSNQKSGTSKDGLPSDPNIAPNTQQPNIQSSEQADEPMEMDFCSLSLPPRFE